MRDEQLLDFLLDGQMLYVGAGQDMIREGVRPVFVKIVMEGWAARYKMLENGRRQIVGFLLPGDLCIPQAIMTMPLDHSIAAINDLHCAMVQPGQLDAVEQESIGIRRALAMDAQISLAIQREWTVNLGARAAPERIGCLICELYLRLKAVGMTQGTGYFCPLTQIELAEAAGVSAVHVNRVIKQMRREDLIRWRDQFIEIPDPFRLARACGFRPNYLQMSF
ncbi:Crp/Fnr family transcriptional regulator [Novosphingobium sediminicola]|uniref:CRP-like cAMP-binding protein n=1 Tax=Novosphingobium sediminicola TaxID=563162 RepID=A0A7W6G7T4_9SPHN|nr:Crp/Fnr family transcriptional regulator [Novosphingobium sediminicola]MBB3956651.1 CRP-like cAMP-binding protein [Novosphingobium sediminicola]